MDVLLGAIDHPDFTIRTAVLKALNRLREGSAELNFENSFVSEQILNEARHYCELNAALAAFPQPRIGRSYAQQIAGAHHRRASQGAHWTGFSAFWDCAIRPRKCIRLTWPCPAGDHEEHTAALEFLDNVLDRNI